MLRSPQQSPPKPIPGLSACASTLDFDPAGQALIAPITALKRRLDRVLNSKAWHDGLVSADDVQWARDQGFALPKKPSGTGIEPQHFIKWIVGPYWFNKHLSAYQLTLFPSWAAVGWNRRLHKSDSPEHAQRKRRELDQDTIDSENGREAAYSSWIAPLPLVVCGEGKHRAELYADYFPDMLTNLGVEALPDASTLLIRRIARAPRLAVLQHTRPDSKREYALLPFPDLSIPLLASIGVRTDASTWLPLPYVTDIYLPGHRAQYFTVSDLLHPERLRTAILEAGYV